MVAADPRQRGFFPLPLLPKVLQASRTDSRSVARRRLRRCHAREWANEGIAALNDLAGHGSAPRDGVKLPSSVATALDDLLVQYELAGKPPADIGTEEEAFRSLLSAFYGIPQEPIG